MKILHSGDIHLREYGGERWDALETLLEVAEKEKVDVVALCGDLFDRGVDAQRLLGKIREVFTGNSFSILLLPGNHDYQIYRKNLFLGKNVSLLVDFETPYIHQEVSFWGIPFRPVGSRELLHLLQSFREKFSSSSRNVLLYHGELLDAFYSRRDFGEEGEERYMPSRLSYFRGLNIDYVLAGHFHSHFEMWRLDKGGYFVYPGSPVSVTRREMGRRKVSLVEWGNPPREYSLDTSYYEEVVVNLDPFDARDPVEKIKKHLESLPYEAKVSLTIRGFVNLAVWEMEEEEFVKKVEEATASYSVGNLNFDYRNVREVVEDELFIKFLERLEKEDFPPEERKRMRDIAIRAMSQARL